MTSTPIADVSAYIKNYTSAKPEECGSSTTNNFNDVLKKQTSDISQKKENVKMQETIEPKKHSKLSSKEISTKVKTEEGSQKSDKVSEEEIFEVVEETAEKMMSFVAQELNLTVEEMEKLLEELGFTNLDLLNAENLASVVLYANGNLDKMELLTNQEVYSFVQSLKETLNEMEESVMQHTGVSLEEAVQVSKEFSEMMVGMQLVEGQILKPEEVVDDVTLKDKKNGSVESTAETSKEQIPEVIVIDKTKQKHENQNSNTASQDNMPFSQNLDLGKNNISSLSSETGAYQTQSVNHIMNQIMDFMKVELQTDLTELEMQLNPESLGKVNVHISSKEGLITAQFTAQNELVKSALESQMIQLKENFAQQGIKVEAVEVNIEYQGFERNMDQNSQPGSGEQGNKKSHTRRLQVEGLDAMDVEELSEEEQLAIHMMEQNGNTVDYTA